MILKTKGYDAEEATISQRTRNHMEKELGISNKSAEVTTSARDKACSEILNLVSFVCRDEFCNNANKVP
jgi:hypothetical protein